MDKEAADLQQLYSAALQPDLYEEIFQKYQASETPTAVPGLSAHIKIAMQVLEKSDQAWELSNENVDAVLRGVHHPAIRICSAGKIAFINEAAKLSFEKESLQAARDLPFDQHVIEELTERRHLIVRKKIIKALRTDRRVMTTLSLTPQSDRSLVVMASEFIWPDFMTGLMKDAFGLTSTESKVLQFLAEGMAASDVAAHRNCSVATIRSQIRSILGKTNCASQADLNRMVQSLALLPSAPEQDAFLKLDPLRIEPSEEQSHFITLPDGRRMQYYRFGAKGGKPVLFLHDAFMGPFCPADFVDRCRAFNLEFIAPARPLYGQSDGFVAGYGSIESIADDIVFLLSDLGINETVIAARTLGTPYAVGVAQKIPTRVKRIVGFVPAMPVGDECGEDGMLLHHRFLANVMSLHSGLFECAVRFSFSYCKRFGVKNLWERVCKNSPLDMRLLQRPEPAMLIEHGSIFSSNHGHKTLLHELRRMARDGRDAYIDCPASMSFYIGDCDENDRFRRTQSLISEGADITIHIVKDGAEFLFYDKTEQCARALHEAWG